MKRAQMIVSEVTSCEGIMRSALLSGLTIILFIALFGLVSTPALAKGHGHHHKHPRACSKTATAAFLACQNEKKDDYWIAQGNCYNSASEDQAECFGEAKKDYKEAKDECRDQLEARKDLCDELGEEPYDPLSDSIDFVANPTGNDYFPLMPGLWTYKTKDEEGEVTETNTVQILEDDTVEIEGVTCVVVHDIVYDGDVDPTTDPDAVIIEDTFDWYAQDVDGNVWYFGERSLAREGCEDDEELCDAYLLTDEGSWKTGIDEAKPGIVMFAEPEEDVVYRQEFALGDAEDAGKIISTTAKPDEDVASPYNCGNAGNGECVQTMDFTPIEPDVIEYKYYKEGFGVVLEEAYDEDGNPTERTELVDYTTP